MTGANMVQRTPQNIRAIAEGQEYPDTMVRELLLLVADDLEVAIGQIEGSRQLFSNLELTIASIVIAAGGEVTVPTAVVEELGAYELEKAPGADGAIVFKTRIKGGAG